MGEFKIGRVKEKKRLGDIPAATLRVQRSSVAAVFVKACPALFVCKSYKNRRPAFCGLRHSAGLDIRLFTKDLMVRVFALLIA